MDNQPAGLPAAPASESRAAASMKLATKPAVSIVPARSASASATPTLPRDPRRGTCRTHLARRARTTSAVTDNSSSRADTRLPPPLMLSAHTATGLAVPARGIRTTRTNRSVHHHLAQRRAVAGVQAGTRAPAVVIPSPSAISIGADVGTVANTLNVRDAVPVARSDWRFALRPAESNQQILCARTATDTGGQVRIRTGLQCAARMAPRGWPGPQAPHASLPGVRAVWAISLG